MDLITKHEISLDLARNNYVAIRLKQYDKNSRKIVITITHNGAEYKLDNTIKAFLQVKKSDGTATADDCIVDVANNKVIATVREQMSAASGVCYADLSLYNTAKKQTLGTMKFNLVFDSSAVTRADVVSSTEFNNLADLVIIGTEKIDNLNQLIEKSDTQLSTFNSAEETRKKNETSRVSAEKNRVAAENLRTNAENERIDTEANRIKAENLREKSETTRKDNESVRIKNENMRIESESTRTENEVGRLNAENERIQAEKNRVSAETDRQTNTNNAINDLKELTVDIETKLQNGDFDGKTILYGDGIPINDLGKVGDVYINKLGEEPYPYYLFMKETSGWMPQWTTRGINGSILNSLESNSADNAPSIEAVNSGFKKVKSKINLWDEMGEYQTDVSLGLVKYGDNNVRMIDSETNTILYPETSWENIVDRPEDFPRKAGDSLPVGSIIPYDGEDVPKGYKKIDFTVTPQDNILSNSIFASEIINQKNKDRYTEVGQYSIDNWILYGYGGSGERSVTLEVLNGKIRLTNNGYAWVSISQLLEDDYVGKTLTTAVSITNFNKETDNTNLRVLIGDSTTATGINNPFEFFKGVSESGVFVGTYEDLPVKTDYPLRKYIIQLQGNGSIEIDNIKLEEEASFTGFSVWSENELFRCWRRFYEATRKTTYGFIGDGYVLSNTSARIFVDLPIEMLKIPTLKYSGNFHVFTKEGTYVPTSMAINNGTGGRKKVAIDCVFSETNLIKGDYAILRNYNDSSASLVLDGYDY